MGALFGRYQVFNSFISIMLYIKIIEIFLYVFTDFTEFSDGIFVITVLEPRMLPYCQQDTCE